MVAPTDKEKPVSAPETKVPHAGDHDRVAMLSLRADGTPDQHNPEFVGDKETALAVTTEQFRQQAVSAADAKLRRPTASDENEVQDPTVAELKKAHDDAAKGAEAAAKKAVDALHEGS